MRRRIMSLTAIAALAAAGVAWAGHTLVVAAVHRGDLVEFVGGWTTRIAGVRAPAPYEPLGREAFEFTRGHLDGLRVAVFTWTSDGHATGIVRDDAGRPFAEIMLGDDEDVDLGALLLERGLARVDEAWLPDHLAHYRDIEAEARAARRGIWGADRPRPARPPGAVEIS